MAELIGVPANTLSRWETGATTPDADSLAAIYSIAMDNDITPSFFQRRKPVPTSNKNRDRLIVMWDFQSYPASALQVPHIDSSIRWEIRRPLKRASFQLFKAFASPNQPDATNGLIELGWRVFEDDHDLDEEIVEQAKSDCAQDPSHTTLALISNDGGYVELIQDLSELGVDVYLFTSLFGYNQRLVAAVGKKRWKKTAILLGLYIHGPSERGEQSRRHCPTLGQDIPGNGSANREAFRRRKGQQSPTK